MPLPQTETPVPTPDHKRYFIEKLGLSERLMERCLGEALSAGGDYADLYFESVTSTSLGIDESLVKSASQGICVGCGIRVLSGERTGYAYTDDLSSDRLLRAARTAALIASGPAKEPIAGFRHTSDKPTLYPIAGATADAEIAAKLLLIQRADKAARAFDPRITQVRAGFNDELRRILIAASDGTFASDTQPLARLNVFVIAKDASGNEGAGSTTRGTSGGGGRVTLDFFEGANSPEHFAREAARTAILQLNAIAAPAGEMPVVLGPGWPGVLLHEAVGHGLEADFNRKKTSAFAGLIGQKVASEKGHRRRQRPHAQPPRLDQRGRRGQSHPGDRPHRERHPQGLSLRQALRPPHGHAQHRLRPPRELPPHPHAAHDQHLHAHRHDLPEDIIKSVQRGLYAVNFGGGQVDITNGKFVFSASEAYLIEDGKVTQPVKGATLIGNGPEALKFVSMVGNDLALDEGIGTCGKAGQSVPVGVGMPTIKLDRMTVGGTG